MIIFQVCRALGFLSLFSVAATAASFPANLQSAKNLYDGATELRPEFPTARELLGSDSSTAYAGRFYQSINTAPANVMLTIFKQDGGFSYFVTTRGEKGASPDFYDTRIVISSKFDKNHNDFLKNLTLAKLESGSWIVNAPTQRVNWRLKKVGPYLVVRHANYPDTGDTSAAYYAVFHKKISEPDLYHTLLRYFEGGTSDTLLELNADYLGAAFTKNGAGEIPLRCFNAKDNPNTEHNGLLALTYEGSDLRARIGTADDEPANYYDNCRFSAAAIQRFVGQAPAFKSVDRFTLVTPLMRMRQLAYGIGINERLRDDSPGIFYYLVEYKNAPNDSHPDKICASHAVQRGIAVPSTTRTGVEAIFPPSYYWYVFLPAARERFVERHWKYGAYYLAPWSPFPVPYP